MLNRMLKQQLKLNTHEAGLVHGKEAPVWGAVTVQRELLKENLCLLLLVRKSLEPLRENTILINLGPV